MFPCRKRCDASHPWKSSLSISRVQTSRSLLFDLLNHEQARVKEPVNTVGEAGLLSSAEAGRH
jgi:hypothetical protein